MELTEIMDELEKLGDEQTKKTFIRHGAQEPLFGVRVGDLKKLVRNVKKNQQLVYDLYDTGNSDAMYLAGLAVDPKAISRERLQDWADKAYWYMLAEYTVASAAAESSYARELALEWMQSDEEMVAVCGWSTYANYVSITPDEQLDHEEITRLLEQAGRTIHEERNRVRYTMNGFVISIGAYVRGLNERAKETAVQIGKVHVDVGQTACKVPLAVDYIEKVEQRGNVGKKRKTCIC
ncbi:DNA alkylation repair protein [Paenibacillus sp. GCM10012307]|uniref:DNA alkylation repair protein n=1 Tax=Paenibacillus roseus TaxID=2798579 RepID=A0A934J9I2_9BACL|nr:DNA alkylation repair protein [Paenibacillus roseus]MBJ6364038.1 DNA alkylation repair protein [Paenibacillus roseus]